MFKLSLGGWGAGGAGVASVNGFGEELVWKERWQPLFLQEALAAGSQWKRQRAL